jgi:purine catabolism regulator
VAWHRDVVSGGMLNLVGPDRAASYAAALLDPLTRHDTAGRGSLVDSLRAWLEQHGQWDPAAVKLGVHRHTLRHRMGKVEQLLGRSLDSPTLRAELWLALQTLPQAPVVSDSESSNLHAS